MSSFYVSFQTPSNPNPQAGSRASLPAASLSLSSAGSTLPSHHSQGCEAPGCHPVLHVITSFNQDYSLRGGPKTQMCTVHSGKGFGHRISLQEVLGRQSLGF